MEKQAERELDALILEVIMDAVIFVRGCLTILDHVCVHLENNPSFNCQLC